MNTTTTLSKSKLASIPWSTIVPWAIIATLAVAVGLLSYKILPDGGYDWRRDIGPAARNPWPSPWLNNGEGSGLPLPPWAAAILFPLGLISDRLATAFTNGLTVVAISLLLCRYGGHWLAVFPIVFSNIFIYGLFGNGQTDWLIILGLLLPAGYDAIIYSLKPQAAFFVIVPRLKKNGWRYLIPVSTAFVLSLVIWGLWPMDIYSRYFGSLTNGWWNASLWPWSAPIGIAFLVLALKRKEDLWGIVASPLLFPYVSMSSYLPAITALFCRWPKTAMVVWIILQILASRIVVAPS